MVLEDLRKIINVIKFRISKIFDFVVYDMFVNISGKCKLFN